MVNKGIGKTMNGGGQWCSYHKEIHLDISLPGGDITYCTVEKDADRVAEWCISQMNTAGISREVGMKFMAVLDETFHTQKMKDYIKSRGEKR